MAERAFVLRIAPGGKDRVPDALKENRLFIGWSDAKGMLNQDQKEMREILHREYYSKEVNRRGAGQKAGSVWRFLEEMKVGDLVVVPHGSKEFYVGEVESSAIYCEKKREDDSAYRRRVNWLNPKKPIPRSKARGDLERCMRARQTCVLAKGKVVAQIRSLLKASGEGG